MRSCRRPRTQRRHRSSPPWAQCEIMYVFARVPPRTSSRRRESRMCNVQVGQATFREAHYTTATMVRLSECDQGVHVHCSPLPPLLPAPAPQNALAAKMALYAGAHMDNESVVLSLLQVSCTSLFSFMLFERACLASRMQGQTVLSSGAQAGHRPQVPCCRFACPVHSMCECVPFSLCLRIRVSLLSVRACPS